jgi:aspartate carbamoyltransferase catalytic subunit
VIDMGKVFRELGGEASVLTELAQLANSFGDLAIVRTTESGAFHRLLDHFRIPVINAGDGDQEHPTHGLADLYALMKWRPALLQPNPPEAQRLTIGIAGWPARSRSVRSFLLALARFPWAVRQVVLVGRHDPPFSPGQREELADAGLTIQTDEELCGPAPIAECLRQIVPTLDVAYADPGPRPMLSRQATVELFEALKPHALVLYPAIRRDDMREQLENSIHNGFFAQSRGAVFVRMALMEAIVGAARGA